MDEGSKVCSRCGEEKPLSDYYAYKGGRRFAHCKPCNSVIKLESKERRRAADPERVRQQIYDSTRRYKLKKKYGMSEADYDEMERAQDGRCAICRMPQGPGRVRRLTVDHDHVTGKIRGLLCVSCNVGIGKLGDTAKTVRQAARYLAKHEAA